ncbi:amidohydrolase family protein [Larkinella rosea]|uniref:Amidohydrolase n=1 Tax=Larkinella rosea TaxID=2025312 RepID=A0A3P1BNI1_9BACT|nr:amidohydrolase family protein [Larkinella rosea]RRB02595.1 amidohydrolase [Larkinella rosea]
MKVLPSVSRRGFITRSGIFLAGTAMNLKLPGLSEPLAEPIIDIHQHTDYMGRTHDQLMAHQRAMGVTTTILLPAGTPAFGLSTHKGQSNGLQAKCSGNETCYNLVKQYPQELLFAANEVPDLPDATLEIEKYLKLGALLIGESKFGVTCDSPDMQRIYELAQSYRVPVLMHWQHGMYNYDFDRFHTMLEKYPNVNFIGHAQTFWANIDKAHQDQTVLYPKTKVTPGGITDRLLSDYPNMYADMSAGSGLNALLRDEEHTRGFLDRHQNKILYGSDCLDAAGHGPECQGSQTIAAIRRLAPSKRIERKILYENAKKLFRL